MPAPRTWLSTSAASLPGCPSGPARWGRPSGSSSGADEGRVSRGCWERSCSSSLPAAPAFSGSGGKPAATPPRRSGNAAAFRRERDTARQEKARAERHLQMVRDRVDQLNRLGNDLLQQAGSYRTGQAVLQEALAFYQELLPEEGSDPRVRREAAAAFRPGRRDSSHTRSSGQGGREPGAGGRAC